MIKKELKKTVPSNHYVDNDQLYDDIVKWKSDYEANPMMPDSIAMAIVAITEGLLRRWNFSGYSENWKVEMLADGIYDGIKGLHLFDPEKSKNPFGYINQSSYYAFLRRIAVEKRETAAMYKNFAMNVYDNISSEIAADETFIQDMHSKISEYEESTKVEPKEKELHNLEEFLGI